LSPRVKETTAKELGPGCKRSEDEGQRVAPETPHPDALAVEWEELPPSDTNAVPFGLWTLKST